MTISVDVLHANILARFDTYQALFDFLDLQIEEFGFDLGAEYFTKKKKISNMQQDYMSDAIHIMNDFYEHIENPSRKEKAYLDLTRIIESLNLIQTMDSISKWLVKKIDDDRDVIVGSERARSKDSIVAKKLPKKRRDAALEFISKIERYVIEVKHNDREEEMCKKCEIPFIIDEKTNEYICKKCGIIGKLFGETFEEISAQQGLDKHNRYDPTKHCKAWINRLQGKENIDIPEHVIDSIKRKIKDDNIYVEILTCEMIRKYLSDLKLSKYNPNVPQIWKRITNKQLDEFTDKEVNQICMYFSRVVQILSDLPENTKTNCPYQPFFIYKIVEQIMSHPRDVERRNNILSRIHLQTRTTIIENDKLWFQICKHIPTFEMCVTRLG